MVAVPILPIAIVAAIILAGKGSYELINKEISRIEATVSWEGSILKTKNFPSEMKKYEKKYKGNNFFDK